MRLSSTLLLVLISMSISCGQNHSFSDNPEFNKIYHYVLQGDITSVLNLLEALDDETLSSHELRVKNKYIDRFVNQTTISLTSSELVNQYISFYIDYWNSSFLHSGEQHDLDTLLKSNLVDFLGTQFTDINQNDLRADVKKYSEEFLRQEGYYANTFGKTAHLYDLFLWEVDDEENYEIALLNDETVNVKVHMMRESPLLGWLGYASFKRSHAGGWATKEALYSFPNSYDLDSEDFKISYLCHEGQHFRDYQNFPSLQAADLEYRAKLVELIKLEGLFWNKMEQFISNGAEIKDQPHPFANYTLINDLSAKVFGEERVTDKDRWKSQDKEEVKKHCQILFDEHTNALNQIGANSAESYILSRN